MSAIRGKNNKTTEIALRMALVRSGISGWTCHPMTLPGKPDFFFKRRRLAVFVDGCFWHACPKCGHLPKTRSDYWQAKLAINQARDRRKSRLLRESGYRVLRIWEHQLKTRAGTLHAIEKIKQALSRK